MAKVRMFRLLKSEPTDEPTFLIGFLATMEVDEYLTMSALTRRMNKSELLREIIDEWRDDGEVEMETLVNRMAMQCYRTWNANYNVIGPGEQKAIDEFNKDLKQDLSARKVSDSTILKIIDKVNGFRTKAKYKDKKEEKKR